MEVAEAATDIILEFLRAIVWLWPEFLLLGGAIALPLLGLRIRDPRPLGFFTMVSLGLAALFTIDQWAGGLGGLSAAGATVPGVHTAVLFEDSNGYGPIVIDKWSLFLRLLFLTIAGLVTIASVSTSRKNQPYCGEYFALLLMTTIGMNIVAMSGDLLAMFIGFELAAVSTFAMTAFRKRDKAGTEAAVKFFLIGAVSSAILLYGVSLLYGTLGTFNFRAMAAAAADPYDRAPLYLGMVLVLVGFSFKIAAVPFHGWAPDTYTGAPHPVSAFLAAGSKKMGVAAAFKVFVVGLILLKADWQVLFGVLAVLTMTLGNVVAIRQTDVKRMLAYSSIAQAGYILIAGAVATPLALAGGLYHILVHMFMKSGGFFVVAAVQTGGGGRTVEDYRGLAKRSPFLAAAMTIFMLSLAGIPPLGGFFSKFFIFAPAVQAGGWFMWLAVAGVLNSAISLYYYARVIKAMLKLEPAPGRSGPIRVPAGLGLVILVCAVLTVATFFFAPPMFDAAFDAAKALLGES